MKEGPITVFKVSGDLTRHFIAEGTLLRNEAKPDLCRTQQVILLKDKSLTKSYFLSNPIGNHHIILPGHHQELLENML
jgi:L-fucose isomerase-like protein